MPSCECMWGRPFCYCSTTQETPEIVLKSSSSSSSSSQHRIEEEKAEESGAASQRSSQGDGNHGGVQERGEPHTRGHCGHRPIVLCSSYLPPGTTARSCGGRPLNTRCYMAANLATAPAARASFTLSISSCTTPLSEPGTLQCMALHLPGSPICKFSQFFLLVLILSLSLSLCTKLQEILLFPCESYFLFLLCFSINLSKSGATTLSSS